MLSWPFSIRFSLRAAFTAFCVLYALPVAAEPAEGAYREMVAGALEGYLQPALTDFEAKAEAGQAAVADLCKSPSKQALRSARAAFAEAALAWAVVEYFDLGPWLEENRGIRIYFFPDRRGVTGRHLRAALQKADPALLGPGSVGASSVALQGLPALEYLLFAKGFEEVLIAGSYRCALARAAASNLAGLATDLRAAWAPGASFHAALTDPAAEGEIARSHKEAATLLLGRLATGLEALVQRKVSAPLGKDLDGARPLRAAFAISGLTNAALVANLRGLRALQRAALAGHALTADELAGLEEAYRAVLMTIEALPRPLGEAASDATLRPQVLSLQAELQRLHRFAGIELLAALGLKVFFSADDGD